MLSETMAQHDGVFNGVSLDPAQAQPAPGYVFPTNKLKRVLDDSSRTPLVLVACGSFSPITFLHLRMFVMAADYANRHTDFEVVGSYLSPVSDAYKKEGLASATHRLKMCSIAVENSPLIMVDSFEAGRDEYTRTALVLDHFDRELNQKLGGATTKEGERKNIRIVLLAGADLVGTFSTPGVWSKSDLDHILGRYGAMIIERHGTNIEAALKMLGPWKHNIWVISQVRITFHPADETHNAQWQPISIRDDKILYKSEKKRPPSRTKTIGIGCHCGLRVLSGGRKDLSRIGVRARQDANGI